MFVGSKVWRVRKDDNFTTICESRQYLDNVGSLTSRKPIGLQGLYAKSLILRRRSVFPVRYELDCKYTCK
jgi:hypothetical protein